MAINFDGLNAAIDQLAADTSNETTEVHDIAAGLQTSIEGLTADVARLQAIIDAQGTADAETQAAVDAVATRVAEVATGVQAISDAANPTVPTPDV